MGIVTFWSPEEKQTSQTASIIASALEMGIERNLKILLLDATYRSDAFTDAFNRQTRVIDDEKLKKETYTDSGTDSLITAALSNKVAPEIVESFTTPIFSNRLDLLFGVRATNEDEFQKKLVSLASVLEIADKHYDVIYVDLQKGQITEGVTKILSMSDLIVYPFEQKIKQINKFAELWGNSELLAPKIRVIPLLTKEDAFSKYNCDNIARKLGIKPGMCSITYNTLYMEALQDGTIIDLFFKLNNSDASYRNNYFLKTILDLNMLIIDRLQQFKYKNGR